MDANTKYQLVGLLGVGGLGGVAAYYLRAKVDVWRASRGAEVTATQAPITVLMQILQNKEKESAALREDLKLLMSNHLEHDSAERKELCKLFTEQNGLLRETCEMIREDRVASAKQRESIHERITQIAVQRAQA